MMKEKIRGFARRQLCRFHDLKYIRFYKRVKKINGISKSHDKTARREWKDRWSGLGLKPRGIYFDVFSRYMTDYRNIVPENICHDIIERILNPVYYDGYYSDKNNFDKFFPKGFLADTILRKMNGQWLDKNYKPVELSKEKFVELLNSQPYDRIVVKPTVESCSGRGVNIIEKKDGQWFLLGQDSEFTYDWLIENYGDNLTIQEALKQSPATGQLNPTSVNTLRFTVYKSVNTNRSVIPSAIIRIGGKGALLDNAHQGGGYARLDFDGKIGDKILNQWGESTTCFNDINFDKEKFVIPDFDKVLEFAKAVGDCIQHHRLIALDVMIDHHGNPRLIEFNTGSSGAYGLWLFQFTGNGAFGQYTDEIIDYCKAHLDDAKHQIII